jgi:DNA-binding GntR family transcriptional regulator
MIPSNRTTEATPQASQPRLSVTAPRLETSTPADASLAEKAYLILRDEIVSLQMAPGSPIRENLLMKKLGFGRTPLREALMRLSRESFVTVVPRRGSFVSEVNIRHLGQIAEIRAEFEAYAASLAAARFADENRAEHRLILDELATLEQEQSYSHLITLDRQVHHFIYSCARNPFLETTLSNYYYLALRLWFLVLDRVPLLKNAVREHQELLSAVGHHDPERASAIARDHVIGFEAEIRSVL